MMKSAIQKLYHKIPFLPSIYRWIFWKIYYCGLPNEDVVVPILSDMKFLITNPRICPIGRSLYRSQVWEVEETELIQSMAKPGMTILDIGAHRGYYTLVFSKQVGDSGRVLAFEPDDAQLPSLYKNLEMNSIKNVSVHELALSNVAGDHTLKVCSVDSLTLHTEIFDEWSQKEDISKVDMVKLDIEGSELNALKGMKGMLEKCHPTLFIEVHPVYLKDFGQSADELIEFLTDLGYKFTPIDSDTLDFSQGNITILCE